MIIRRNFISIFLILLICILSNINYFLNGKSIYHITSIAASPLYYIKLQIDNFKNLNFHPQYWQNKAYTGGPIHTGLGVYNPLLFFFSVFDKFSDAIIFYDILLKFIGGVGIYLLLRKYDFSKLTSLCCSLIYPLNPFYISFGQDPQFSSIVYFLPCIILVLELIIEHVNRKIYAFVYSLVLALILSLCYLSSNIQSYAFLLLLIIAPFVFIQIDRNSLKQTFIIISFIGLAFILNFLLVTFEIIPTIDTIRSGNRSTGETFNPMFYKYIIGLWIGAFSLNYFFKLKNPFFYYFVITTIILTLIYHQGNKTLHNILIANYFHKMTEIDYFRSTQGKMRFFFTLMQLPVLIFGLIKVKRIAEQKKITLVYIALSYFALKFFIFLMPRYSVIPYLGERFSFIPIVGIIIALALGLDSLRVILEKKNLNYIMFFILLILPLENYCVFLNRVLFTEDLTRINKKNIEYTFLSKIRPTERTIDTYENEHKQWKKSFNPKLMPKWLMPPYFGASTFSRVGIGTIPMQNAEYNKLAMPLYFGVDSKKPLTPLLNLAGVKYIFSLQKVDREKNLKLLQKGDEYFIYENTEALPRVMLFSDVEHLNANVILSTVSSQNTEDLLKRVYVSNNEKIDLNKRGENVISLMNDTTFESNLGKVYIKKYENEYIEIDCNIKEKSFFMLTDTYFDGWKAYIEGKERKIIRADYIYRGLKLYPGNYSLVMKYESERNRYGLYISFATFILILLSLVYFLHTILRKNAVSK